VYLKGIGDIGLFLAKLAAELHHTLPTMMFCFATHPKAMKVTEYELKCLKTRGKTNLSSFKLIVSGILSQCWKAD
jgi:hypothetical protein